MKTIRKNKLIILMAFVLIAANNGVGQNFMLSDDVPAELEVKNQYKRNSLSGNIKPMEALLREKQSESRVIKELFDKFRNRFIDRTEVFESSGDKYVDDVLDAFRGYWISVLIEGAEIPKANADLVTRVKFVNGKHGLNIEQDPRDVIRLEFEKRGFYLLTGLTAPYLELMIWKKQTETTYSVELTDGKQNLMVVALDDFVSNGWLSFSSFGINASAGWATSDKLFVVASQYEIGSESFEVSYLKHEARHLVDKRLFPSLKGFELEYRAKLTELAFAEKTSLKLINKFIVEANGDSDAAHPKANFKLISKLSQTVFKKAYESDLSEWQKIATPVIQKTARMLLEADTRRIENESKNRGGPHTPRIHSYPISVPNGPKMQPPVSSFEK